MQLENQGFRVFLPKVKTTTRRARRWQTTSVPLFPRYMFVRLDLERDRWRSVNGTIGVSKMVMQGDRPLPAPAGVVEAFLDHADNDGLLRYEQETDLMVGKAVEIMTGPLAAQMGQIVKLDSSERVHVLLQMLGATRRVIVSGEDIRPAA